MNNYCIYILTNKFNGKVYIGKTAANTKRRWNDHIRSSQSEDKQYIHCAMAKYGFYNFEFKIVEYFETEDEAYDAEAIYIKKYNSFGPGGYNETPGGRGAGGSNRKLEDIDVINLINDYINADVSTTFLSKKYKLSKTSVKDILNRKIYVHVSITEEERYQIWLKLRRNYHDDENFGTNSSFLKLTPETVKSIFKDYATEKYSFTDLSKKYDTVVGNISFLLNRETQNNIEIDEITLNKVNELLNKIAISARRTAKEDRSMVKSNIFTDFRDGLSKKEISEKYNLTLDKVVRVLNHTAWKNVPLLDETLRQYSTGKITRITPDEAYNIIIDYCNGLSVNDLKLKYNTRNSIIYKIIRRETFKDLNIGEYENLCKEQLMKRNNQTKYINTPKTNSFLTQEERVNYYKLNILLAGQTKSSITKRDNWKLLLGEVEISDGHNSYDMEVGYMLDEPEIYIRLFSKDGKHIRGNWIGYFSGQEPWYPAAVKAIDRFVQLKIFA